MDKNARIFIAGHRGLIGSAFLRRFQQQGFTNILTRTRAELELTDRTAVNAFFAQHKPEYVVMAAGKVGGIVENQQHPADFMNQNLQVQLNMFEAAHEHGAKRVLFLASSCMYPRECPQPMAENTLLTGHPEPTSLAYALAKLAGLQHCLSYNKQYGTPVFIPVIPNSVYGPNDNFNPATGHVLSALIHRFHEAKANNAPEVTLWGSGSPCREFLYSDDLAEAGELMLKAENPALPVNIGPGVDISIRALAETIARTIDYKGNLVWDTTKPDGAPRKLLDSARIKALGWQPRTSFEDGLRQTYDWYLNNWKRP